MRRVPGNRVICGILSLLLASACSSAGKLDIIIKDSDEGAVYIERSEDRSFQAAHPIAIPETTIARILRGIAIQESPGFLRNLLGSKPRPVSVFREEEVQFLTPLLVEGLSRAASDQRIGFRLGRASASPTVKAGTLYAFGRSLYITLPWIALESRYGAGGTAPSKTVLFTPEAATRPDSHRKDSSPDTIVIVDYELLASIPDESSPALQTSPSAESAVPSALQPQRASDSTDTQLRTLQEQMQEKNAEVEELKKELQEIRKQLQDSAELSSKGKKKPLAVGKDPK